MRYKKMNPKQEDLKLVEYFDMEYTQVKEMPPQYQNVLNSFAFSFDIVAGACRQKGFVDQAVVFYDCTRKNFEKFQRDYKMFLELINKRPQRQQFLVSVVPTLAIDLLWHTHMRVIELYVKDTSRILGSILDHNDDLPQTQLDDGLNYTIRLWRKTYKKAYIKGSKDGEYKVKRYHDSYDNGSLFVIGVWGYPYYIPPCHNSTWNWDGHGDHGHHGGDAGSGPGDIGSCGGGVSCGGSTCSGGSCSGGGADGGSCGGGSSCGGDGGGSSCGGDGGGSSCGGGCGGGGCGG